MPRRSLACLYKDEFSGYSLAKFQQDLLAGLTIAGVHDNAYNMMKRGGLADVIGEKNFFWSRDQAIVEAEKRGCKFCPQE